MSNDPKDPDQDPQSSLEAGRAPFERLQGLHVPIGLHVSALVPQVIFWIDYSRLCHVKDACGAPWIDQVHLLTAAGGLGAILYFWLGFALLQALLDRDPRSFRKAPTLALSMGAMSLLALAVAMVSAWWLGAPEVSHSGPVIY